MPTSAPTTKTKTEEHSTTSPTSPKSYVIPLSIICFFSYKISTGSNALHGPLCARPPRQQSPNLRSKHKSVRPPPRRHRRNHNHQLRRRRPPFPPPRTPISSPRPLLLGSRRRPPSHSPIPPSQPEISRRANETRYNTRVWQWLCRIKVQGR